MWRVLFKALIWSICPVNNIFVDELCHSENRYIRYFFMGSLIAFSGIAYTDSESFGKKLVVKLIKL